MARRTVSLETGACERLRVAKRPGESFSEDVNRLLQDSVPSFRVLAGVLRPRDADRVRKAVIAMRRREARQERAKLAESRGSPRGRHA
jgi:predicted CopG family antitoxin